MNMARYPKMKMTLDVSKIRNISVEFHTLQKMNIENEGIKTKDILSENELNNNEEALSWGN